MNIFEGKSVIITGGASGIGLALATALHKRGALVTIADRNAELLEKAASSISDKGAVKTARLNVTDRQAVQKLVDDVVQANGKLDYIFNNAGIGIGGEAIDFEYDDWKNVIDVNLYGVVNGVFAAYPVMVKQGFGHIINTASLAGLTPFPGEISYVASKFAVVGISETLRIEGADWGVKVSVVCPGMIRTPIYETSKIVGLPREEALAHFPEGISAEECAKVIIKGIEKNKSHIVVTGLAKALWYAYRVSPALVGFIGRKFIKKLRATRKD